MRTYGSEGENIKGRENDMGNGNNGKVSWDMLLKISQVMIMPALAALLYLLLQINTMDKRLAVMEVTISRPSVDVGMVQKLGIMEDRQITVIRRLDSIERDLNAHREESTYDSIGKRKRER